MITKFNKFLNEAYGERTEEQQKEDKRNKEIIDKVAEFVFQNTGESEYSSWEEVYDFLVPYELRIFREYDSGTPASDIGRKIINGKF